MISILASCTEKVISVPFSVDPVSVEAEASENHITINVSSPASWVATSSESWCRIVPSSGSATSSIGTDLSLTLDENNGFERRCYLEIVTDSGEKAIIQVSQNHSGKGVVIENDTYRISGGTTHLEIPFRSGRSPVVDIHNDWISLERISDERVELSIERYDSLINRTGILQLATPENDPIDIHIIQGDGFSDPALYNYMLERYDRDSDGILTKQDLSSVRTVTVELMNLEQPITRLDGFGCIPSMEEFGPWLSSCLTSMVITDCPSLQSVDFNDGERLERAVFRNNPRLEDLTLVNGYFGDNCSTLKHLVVEGCDNIKNLRVQLTTFEEGMSLEPLPHLRSVDFQFIDGIRGLDFSQSPQLENVTVYPDRHGTGQFKYLLIPKSIASKAKIDVSNTISIVYK